MKNTKKQGKFTLFVYPEKPNYYIGVCLEFDLIQEGKTPQETMENIKKTTFNYLITIIKKKWPDYLLNRLAPKHYWEKYNKYLKRREEETKKRELEKRRLFWQQYLQEYLYTPKSLRESTYA